LDAFDWALLSKTQLEPHGAYQIQESPDTASASHSRWERNKDDWRRSLRMAIVPSQFAITPNSLKRKRGTINISRRCFDFPKFVEDLAFLLDEFIGKSLDDFTRR
jgi:hypothetical protein